MTQIKATHLENHKTKTFQNDIRFLALSSAYNSLGNRIQRIFEREKKKIHMKIKLIGGKNVSEGEKKRKKRFLV